MLTVTEAECTLNRAIVFEREIMVHGGSKLVLASTMLCRVQICTVLGSLASK